jgi:hypothetical protein
MSASQGIMLGLGIAARNSAAGFGPWSGNKYSAIGYKTVDRMRIRDDYGRHVHEVIIHDVQ